MYFRGVSSIDHVDIFDRSAFRTKKREREREQISWSFVSLSLRLCRLLTLPHRSKSHRRASADCLQRNGTSASLHLSVHTTVVTLLSVFLNVSVSFNSSVPAAVVKIALALPNWAIPSAAAAAADVVAKSAVGGMPGDEVAKPTSC